MTKSIERWSDSPNKEVVYELLFKKELMKPGTQFKIKNDRTVYTFHCLVHNKTIDENGQEVISTWIECMSNKGYRSIRPERIMKVITAKRSYKNNVD